MIKRGVAICHYNRPKSLQKVLEGVLDTVPAGTKVVICDDGSEKVPRNKHIVTITGPNLGVAANKNRGLWALQDCHFICLLEDDLIPTQPGWFESYEEVCRLTNNHHICRVQDKEVPDNRPNFTEYLKEKGYTPLFGSSPRGDLTFITSEVIRRVGAFNPQFLGAGYAHGEFSDRVWDAGLISHPLKWWDVKECRDKFVQFGDTEGGRWDVKPEVVQSQIKRNKAVWKKLKTNPYGFHPLVLS